LLGLGDTFLLRKPGEDIEHLWIVLTAPCPKTGMVVMANVTTEYAHSDTTTKVVEGDHPFLNRPSVVFYADAREAEVALIDKAIKGGIATTHRACNEGLLERVQAGLMASAHTKPKVKAAFEAAKKEGRDKPGKPTPPRGSRYLQL
jgi:hypothetical protein